MDTRAYTGWITDMAHRSHVDLQTVEDGTALATHFYPGGRTQSVVIWPLVNEDDERVLIAFFAPAVPVEREDARFFRLCLEANASMSHGAWAIRTVKGERTLGVYDVVAADGLTPEQFAAIVKSVTDLADNLEKSLGIDRF